jgi:Ribbon-helix-helix protein, copG family
MTTKIRKQIYLEKRQDQQLKRMAEARGVSQAEVIRALIDAQSISASALPPDPAAWEKARQTMLELLAKGPITNRRRTWKRNDLYEERESRYGHRSD